MPKLITDILFYYMSKKTKHNLLTNNQQIVFLKNYFCNNYNFMPFVMPSSCFSTTGISKCVS